MMNVVLDFSSISEEVLKKYLNDRGEGILNMLLDKCEPNELAYTEFEPRGQRQLHEIRKGIRIEGPIQIQVDVDGFDPKEFHKRTAQEPLPPVVKEAYLAVGHVIQGVMLGD